MSSKIEKTFKEGDIIEITGNEVVIVNERNQNFKRRRLADKSGWITTFHPECYGDPSIEIKSFADVISRVLYKTGIAEDLKTELLPFLVHPNRTGDEVSKQLLTYRELAMRSGESGSLIIDEPRMKPFRLKFVLEEEAEFTVEDLQFDYHK